MVQAREGAVVRDDQFARDAEHEAWVEWMRRIFGTPEAYEASLPSRIWIEGDAGWTSIPR